MKHVLKTKTCQHCDAWDCPEPLSIPRVGFCRRHPPQLIFTAANQAAKGVAIKGTMWAFPTAGVDMWCKEFLPTKEDGNGESKS